MRRTAIVSALLLLCSVSAFAEPPAQPAASTPAKVRAPLTTAQRERAAIRVVKKAVMPWVRGTDDVKIRAALVGFNGDAKNPITGPGPVEVYVNQTPKTPSKTLLGRMGRSFDKFAKRKFTVDVDRNGDGHILAMESGALHHRLGRALAETLPLREIGSDILRSQGVKDGLVTGGLSAMATAYSPALGAIGLARAGQLIVAGIQRRTEARKAAFDSTVTWAKEQGKGGDWPTLVETYRFYTTTLAEAKPGTRPMGLKQFAEQLSGKGL